MIIYNVVGTAPLGADRVALYEHGPGVGMVSFYDAPKAFTSLSTQPRYNGETQ